MRAKRWLMGCKRFFVTFATAGLLLVMCLIAQAQTQAPKLKNADEGRYRLNPGDVVEVQYRYTPEFNQTVTVQPDGFVSLEIGGEIKIGGLMLEQARLKILDKEQDQLKDPEVTLILKEFQKPYFVVAGEVTQPGRFEMRESITALQAILLAGGFKDSANSAQVLVFRKINSDFAEVRLLNLGKIKKTSDLEKDLTLQAGDMIMVPRNKVSKIERYVRLGSLAALLNPLLR